MNDQTPGEEVRNYYRLQGAEHERERILELLTQLRSKAQRDKGLTTNVNINAIIALIKGKQ